jgi:signal transduction histidine kinase
MDLKRLKKLHLIRNLPLKWSFVLYVLICVLVVLTTSSSISGFFDTKQNGILKHYENLYREEFNPQGDVGIIKVQYGNDFWSIFKSLHNVSLSMEKAGISDDREMQEDTFWAFTAYLFDTISERDIKLLNLYATLYNLAAIVIPALFIIATSVIFYRRKLRKPIAILGSASKHIAEGDLDFKLEYDNRNEFGRLIASFETMRKSLFEANREMWRMVEGRKRLNAAFAHDLRTPLTVLRGYCDFLLKYAPEGKIDDEKALSTLATMDVYLRRLEGYTESMSSLQKLEELTFSPEGICFEELCETLKNSGVMLAGERLDFHSEGAGMLHVDMPAVLRVYENLISNAARYAKNKVKVTCSLADVVLRVSVADDGPGFSPEALKSATEPYFRDDKLKEGSDATHFGLGLYICKLLCEKHGGALALENAPGGTITANFAMLPHE